jgi:hypothetical protein
MEFRNCGRDSHMSKYDEEKLIPEGPLATVADPGRKPYEGPVLVEWGSIVELTAGAFVADEDGDFSGSGGV